MNLQQLLELTIARSASDLHLIAGFPPMLRINGELIPVQGETELSGQDVENMALTILLPDQKEILYKNWEIDLGIDYKKMVRFRVNLYKQGGTLAGAFRLIPKEIRPVEDIGLPQVVMKLLDLKQGFVLVTGPTGHGKSTTLASFINYINRSRAAHIITVEDPVEFVYPKAKSIISQREINFDTRSWGNALRSALREDPDIVLIGEMRDLETISAALTIAETGHLVFATLHTNSAAQTIDRIIDVFPNVQQQQIRSQLASVLEAVISQRLVPTISPGRAMAAELMFSTSGIKAIIRDGKTHQIDNLIQTSGEFGMRSMEMALTLLVREGLITVETAQNYATRPQLIGKLLNAPSVIKSTS